VKQGREKMELREGGSGYSRDGVLFLSNVEVGIDRVILKVQTSGRPIREEVLRLDQALTYDAGSKGRFEIRLIGIEEGSPGQEIPASARFSVCRP
jgi:hypothetical protein